jgi:hypothetical protein
MTTARTTRAGRRHRTTGEVFRSHLRLRERGDLETDLQQNYARKVVLVTYEGVYRGYRGARRSARVLKRFVPDGKYRYTNRHVVEDYAYLEWRANPPRRKPCHGWDSFVIRRGRIVAQMIYFHCGK